MGGVSGVTGGAAAGATTGSGTTAGDGTGMGRSGTGAESACSQMLLRRTGGAVMGSTGCAAARWKAGISSTGSSSAERSLRRKSEARLKLRFAGGSEVAASSMEPEKSR